jgi:hypothetical protein
MGLTNEDVRFADLLPKPREEIAAGGPRFAAFDQCSLAGGQASLSRRLHLELDSRDLVGIS